MSFEEVFTKSFHDFLEEKINKAVDTAIQTKVQEYLERDFKEKIEEVVSNMMEGSSLDDFFDVESAVDAALCDIDLSGYIDVTDAVEDYMSGLDMEELITADTLRNSIREFFRSL